MYFTIPTSAVGLLTCTYLLRHVVPVHVDNVQTRILCMATCSQTIFKLISQLLYSAHGTAGEIQ